jgi:hypothetical protein
VYRAVSRTVFGVALLAAAGPARAQTAEAPPPGLTLVRPEALPFSDADLQQALKARLSPVGRAGPPHATVEPVGEEAVTVSVGEASQLVTLGDRSGPAAARVVALVIAELVSEAAEASPAPAAAPAAEPKVVAAPAAPHEPPASISVGAEPVQGRAWARRLSVTAGLAKGTNGEEWLAETLDVDLALDLPWEGPRLYPSIGLTIMPTRNQGQAEEASFRAIAARALAGGRLGPVDVAAGLVVSPYSIGGAVLHSGVLVGGETMGQLMFSLSHHLRLCTGLRVDVFADRVRALFADGRAYATPRIQIGLGVGLAWDWAS